MKKKECRIIFILLIVCCITMAWGHNSSNCHATEVLSTGKTYDFTNCDYQEKKVVVHGDKKTSIPFQLKKEGSIQLALFNEIMENSNYQLVGNEKIVVQVQNDKKQVIKRVVVSANSKDIQLTAMLKKGSYQLQFVPKQIHKKAKKIYYMYASVVSKKSSDIVMVGGKVAYRIADKKGRTSYQVTVNKPQNVKIIVGSVLGNRYSCCNYEVKDSKGKVVVTKIES